MDCKTQVAYLILIFQFSTRCLLLALERNQFSIEISFQGAFPKILLPFSSGVCGSGVFKVRDLVAGARRDGGTAVSQGVALDLSAFSFLEDDIIYAEVTACEVQVATGYSLHSVVERSHELSGQTNTAESSLGVRIISCENKRKTC